jgi:acyl-CoA synthetase (NDP forming)
VSLEAFFRPRSIALIGASADPTSISARPLRMLRQHGFTGALYPVNPRHAELLGMRVYPDVGAIPEVVDLALVAVPAPLVPGVLQACVAAGVRHAVVFSSGFAEAGGEGQRLQEAIAMAVADSNLRVCGPNAEGFYYPPARVCATFSPAVDPEHGFEMPPAGRVAIVSQSGGLGFALLNRGRDLGLTCGAVVSTGNEVDLTFVDYVDYLLDDPEIGVVLGFLESVRDRQRLAQVAQKAAQLRKPLVVAKVGRSEAGRHAARAHTGSDTGDEESVAALFEQLGILRAEDVDDMLDLAAMLSIGQSPEGRRLALLTTSGGAGAWLADACAEQGFQMPPTPDNLQDELGSFIPSYGSTDNPVDITAQAVFSGGFHRALSLLAAAPDFDVVACVGSMVREDHFFETLPELRAAIAGSTSSIVFYAYTQPSPTIVSALAELGIPCYPTPLRAARALGGAARYREFLRRVAAEAAAA